MLHYEGQRCDVGPEYDLLADLLIETGLRFDSRKHLTESIDRLVSARVVQILMQVLGRSRWKDAFWDVQCFYYELAQYLNKNIHLFPPLLSLSEVWSICAQPGLSLTAEIACRVANASSLGTSCRTDCWVGSGVFVSAAVTSDVGGPPAEWGAEALFHTRSASHPTVYAYAGKLISITPLHREEMEKAKLEIQMEEQRLLILDAEYGCFREGDFPFQLRAGSMLGPWDMLQWAGRQPPFDLETNRTMKQLLVDQFHAAIVRELDHLHLMALVGFRKPGLLYIVTSLVHDPEGFARLLLKTINKTTDWFRWRYRELRLRNWEALDGDRKLEAGENFGHHYVRGAVGILDESVSPFVAMAPWNGSFYRKYHFSLILQYTDPYLDFVSSIKKPLPCS